MTTTNLAQVYATLGDQKTAIAKYREAESMSAKLNPAEIDGRMAPVYGGLGTSLGYEKKYDEALANFEKALKTTRRNGMEASEGIVLNTLGRLAAVSGNRPEAEKYFQRAITLSERPRNQASVPEATTSAGSTFRTSDTQMLMPPSSDRPRYFPTYTIALLRRRLS